MSKLFKKNSKNDNEILENSQNKLSNNNKLLVEFKHYLDNKNNIKPCYKKSKTKVLVWSSLVVCLAIIAICVGISLFFVNDQKEHKGPNNQIVEIQPEITKIENGDIKLQKVINTDGKLTAKVLITPNEGYKICKVLIDSVNQNLENIIDGQSAVFYVGILSEKHTISAKFELLTFQITTQVGEGGTITSQNPKVNYNGDIIFTITPEAGYELDTILLDEVRQQNPTKNPNETYTFAIKNVIKSHTLKVTFYQTGSEGLTYQGLNSNGEKVLNESEIVSYEIAKYTNKENNVVIPKYHLNKPVTSIGEKAFAYLGFIKKITIPNSITTIKDSAFGFCIMLSDVGELPSSLTQIGDSVFIYCLSLKNIYVNKNNPNYCDKNGRELLSKDGKTIFAYAQASGKTYSVPNAVTTIKRSAFEWSNLENIEIPNSVTVIEDKSFFNTNDLKNIKVDINNTKYKDSYGRSLLTKDGKTLLAYANNSTTADNKYEYSIPIGVSTIYKYAFANCNKVNKVDIPDSLTSIQTFAFNECSSLQMVSITSSCKLRTIESNAFSKCEKLESIYIPKFVNSISNTAFLGCTALKSFYVDRYNWYYKNDDFGKALLTKRGETLIFFANNSTYQYSIPNGVQNICENAFNDCRNLTYLYFPSTVNKIEYLSFRNCNSLKTLKIDSLYIAKVASDNGNCLLKYAKTVYVKNNITEINSDIITRFNKQNYNDVNYIQYKR